MNADQLPETFSVQTIIHIHDADWDIEEAIPENSIDFSKTKSLKPPAPEYQIPNTSHFVNRKS